MTDREMLELAAKAALIVLTPMVVSNVEFNGDDRFVGLMADPERWSRGWFDPLNNNDDAFLLAVRLGIDVSHDEIGMKSFVYARAIFNDVNHIGLSEVFDDGSERLERTRRAITRAAAEIGKEMK